MENYINGYSVGVGSGGIDNVSTTLPVSLAASVSGGFRILVDNEKMLVTAGGTTTSWTVTRAIEGSAAASHAVAAAIYIVITAGSPLTLPTIFGLGYERRQSIMGADHDDRLRAPMTWEIADVRYWKARRKDTHRADGFSGASNYFGC